MYLSLAKRFVWLFSALDGGLRTFSFFPWLVLSMDPFKQMLLLGYMGEAVWHR